MVKDLAIIWSLTIGFLGVSEGQFQKLESLGSKRARRTLISISIGHQGRSCKNDFMADL